MPRGGLHGARVVLGHAYKLRKSNTITPFPAVGELTGHRGRPAVIVMASSASAWYLRTLSKPWLMDRPSLDQLHEQRRKMRAELAALSVRASRAKANAKAREKSASRQWVLVGFYARWS